MANSHRSAKPSIAGASAVAAIVAVVAVLVLAAVAAPAAARTDAAGAAATAGAAVYKDNCIGCHGADGSGNTPIGKGLKAGDLRKPEIQAKKDAELAASILNGKGKMPSTKGKLTAAQVDQVLAYVRGLAKPK
jgi:mono/diheme cytochrome c family protein